MAGDILYPDVPGLDYKMMARNVRLGHLADPLRYVLVGPAHKKWARAPHHLCRALFLRRNRIRDPKQTVKRDLSWTVGIHLAIWALSPHSVTL